MQKPLQTIGQMAHYQITDLVLGEGGSSNVHLTYDTANDRYLAVKIIPSNKKRQVLQELKALKRLQGLPGVIQVEWITQHEEHYFMFMEIAEKELYDYLMQCGGRLEEDHSRVLFQQMAFAVAECHSQRIYHHDVKLENFVLVSKGGYKSKEAGYELRLIDFGFAVDLSNHPASSTWDDSVIDNYFAGSPAYSSPQVLSKSAHSAAKNDIFALGVSLYVLLCGQFPFCDVTKDSLDRLRKNICRPLSFPSHVLLSDSAKDLLRGMLCYNEHDRFTMEEVLSHDWTRGYTN